MKQLPILSDNNYNFFNSIRNIEILDDDVEKDLIRKYQENDDDIALQKLLYHNFRYINFFCQNYVGYNVSSTDLIQEGAMGFCEAVKKFDLNSDCKLITYANHYIKSYMSNYALKNNQIFGRPKTKPERKLFFKKHLFNTHTDNEISEQLDVKIDDVRRMRDNFFMNDMVDLEITSDEKTEASGIDNVVADKSIQSNPEMKLFDDYKKKIIMEAVESVGERKSDILIGRYFTIPKVTLTKLGEKHNISHERVSQLEKEALKEIKHYISEALN